MAGKDRVKGVIPCFQVGMVVEIMAGYHVNGFLTLGMGVAGLSVGPGVQKVCGIYRPGVGAEPAFQPARDDMTDTACGSIENQKSGSLPVCSLKRGDPETINNSLSPPLFLSRGKLPL